MEKIRLILKTLLLLVASFVALLTASTIVDSSSMSMSLAYDDIMPNIRYGNMMMALAVSITACALGYALKAKTYVITTIICLLGVLYFDTAEIKGAYESYSAQQLLFNAINSLAFYLGTSVLVIGLYLNNQIKKDG